MGRCKRREIATLRTKTGNKQGRIRDFLKHVGRVGETDHVADIGGAAFDFRPLAERRHELEHGTAVRKFLPLKIG